MITPISSATPYASASDFINRQDVGLIGQLALDNGAIASTAQILDPTTTAGANVLTALLDASGEIEYAATRGQRYSPTDLQSLTGASLGFLKRICCDIASMNLWDRRDGQEPPQNVVEKYKRAQEFLKNLVDGERVFGSLQAQEAGLASSQFFSITQRVQDRLISANWPRAFGNRASNGPNYNSSLGGSWNC